MYEICFIDAFFLRGDLKDNLTNNKIPPTSVYSNLSN